MSEALSNTHKVTTFDRYADLAIQTAIYPNKGANIAYPVLGLIGETGELVNAIEAINVPDDLINVKKEFGDVLWYLNAVCYETEQDFGHMWRRVHANQIGNAMVFVFRRLQIHEARVAEIAKKALRDNHGVVADEKIPDLINRLEHIVSALKTVAISFNFDIIEIMQMNVDKLYDRMDRGALQGEGDNR